MAERSAQIIADLCIDAHRSGHHVETVALGICEVVDGEGALCSRSTIDWVGLDLDRALKIQLPIHVVSDVRAAALAEARLGAARGVSHALYVSIGTGISSTLLIEGKPYAGAHGAALVLASAKTVQHGDACGSSSHTLERVASGAGLVERYGQASSIDAREIIRRAEAGDDAARAVVRRASTLLGEAIAQLANCIDPEVIVVGGGLGTARGLYWDLLRPAIESGLWKGQPAIATIVQSVLGADCGVAGAALAACDGVH